jgi:polysaccharide biosynthesis transport protein
MSPKQVLVILWRRLWIVVLTFASTLAGAGGVLVLVPPRYDAAATASIDPGQGDPITGQVSGGTMVGLLEGNLAALVKSERVALDVVKRLNLANNPASLADYQNSPAFGRVDINEWLAGEIVKNVDAKFALGTSVLTITYKSPSPVQGALIANSFLSSFIDAAVAMKVSSAQQIAQWFAPQMDKLRADLNGARDRLAEFQREGKLLTPNAGGDSDSAQLMAVTAELSSSKGELAVAESRLNAQASGDAAANSSTDSPDADSQLLESLKAKAAATATEIGRLQAEVGPNNPKLSAQVATLKSLQDQVHSETAVIHDKLVARIDQLKNQIQSLEVARSNAQQEMIAVQGQRARMSALTRDVEFRQEQVDAASKAEAQARLQSQLSFSNISTLDEATPPIDPAFPKPLLVELGGVGLGLALGVIFAFLVEAFDRRIRAASDLDFATSAPLLGTLAGASTSRRRRIGRGKSELVRQAAA